MDSEADPRVLVVDDDPALAEVVARYLRRDGYEVDYAADGATGLERALATLPDLVVLDLMMPGMDGFEVCRRLRRTTAIPVVMLTARGEETDRITGLDLGADDYVTKPFSPGELAARVRAVLRRLRPGLAEDRVRFGDIVVDRVAGSTTRSPAASVAGRSGAPRRSSARIRASSTTYENGWVT